MADVLIIDDDKSLCLMLSELVQTQGHRVSTAYNLKDGLKKLSAGNHDVVYLDVRLPDGNGLDILPRIKKKVPSPEVIIMTAMGDADGAELAIRNEAWDYIEKPSSIHMFLLPLIRALQFREATSQGEGRPPLRREGIVGSSSHLSACLDLVWKSSQGDTPVLITGETGTGKELLAEAIHRNSPRSEKSFVILDCAALKDTLVESILFGHERGAFTGADRARVGLIGQADGGTLFLDEVGELPLSIQKNFLRVLQERKYRPLGSKKETRSDFRLIAATNRNLNEMVAAGQFRSDLLYRLQGIHIEIPPLRERPDDIRDLTLHYLSRMCLRSGMEAKGLSPDLLEALMLYDWPGNVRELINTLERTFAVAQDEATLFSRHLPDQIRIKLARKSLSDIKEGATPEQGSADESFQEYRTRMDRHYLKSLMIRTENSPAEACRISRLSRSRLYALLNQHDLLSRSPGQSSHPKKSQQR